MHETKQIKSNNTTKTFYHLSRADIVPETVSDLVHERERDTLQVGKTLVQQHTAVSEMYRTETPLTQSMKDRELQCKGATVYAELQ